MGRNIGELLFLKSILGAWHRGCAKLEISGPLGYKNIIFIRNTYQIAIVSITEMKIYKHIQMYLFQL